MVQRIQYPGLTKPPEQTGEEILVDNWFQPASEPVRRPAAIQALQITVTEPSLFTTPGMDTWFHQQPEPLPARHTIAESQSVSTVEPITEEEPIDPGDMPWYQPASRPVLPAQPAVLTGIWVSDVEPVPHPGDTEAPMGMGQPLVVFSIGFQYQAWASPVVEEIPPVVVPDFFQAIYPDQALPTPQTRLEHFGQNIEPIPNQAPEMSWWQPASFLVLPPEPLRISVWQIEPPWEEILPIPEIRKAPLVPPVRVNPMNPEVLRHFTDIVAAIMNSLSWDGILHITGPSAFGLAGLFFSGSGAPASTLGYVGCFYLDLDTGQLYKKEESLGWVVKYSF